jgi:hypothetical protein
LAVKIIKTAHTTAKDSAHEKTQTARARDVLL